MTDRREYMREYKRAYRAKIGGKFAAGDTFLSMGCLSLEEAEKRGGGAVTSWALMDGGVLIEKNGISDLFDVLRRVNCRSTIYICNIKVWARFLIAEALKRGFKVSRTCKEENSYRIAVDLYGEWLGIDLNVGAGCLHFANFNGIIMAGLANAYRDFCNKELAANASESEKAIAMFEIMREFKSTVKSFAQGIVINATTISGYAQKLCDIFASESEFGGGDFGPSSEYGRHIFRRVFPEIPREVGDALRAARVYRSGWNYISPIAKEFTGAGFALDRRSFYPFIFSHFKLPIGMPEKINAFDAIDLMNELTYGTASILDGSATVGDYTIFNISEIVAHLKPNGVPCIQLFERDPRGEYLKTINAFNLEKTMFDSFDILALYENYDVDLITIGGGAYNFRAVKVDFLEEYAERLFEFKEQHRGTARGVTAKFLINSLSGRFGLNSYRREVDPVKNGDYSGKLEFVGEKGYLPAAIAINSIGRWLITSDARAAGNDFIYSDTDSIYLKNKIPSKLANAIGKNMGDFEVDVFNASRWFGRKCYGVQMLDGWKWTVAGASPEMLKDLKGDVNAGEVLRGGVVPITFDDWTIAFKEREFTLAANMIF